MNRSSFPLKVPVPCTHVNWSALVWCNVSLPLAPSTHTHTLPLLLQVNDSSDQLPSKVLHWGGGSKEGSSLTGPQSSEILVELGAKQIVASDKHRIVLTVNGLVYSLKAKSNGEYDATVSGFEVTYLHYLVTHVTSDDVQDVV